MPESPEKVRDSFTPQALRARVEALRRLYEHGALSSTQFNDFLSAFRFNDDIGHLWTPGATSGKWYRWDRNTWTEAEPPAALMLANENMQRSAEWMLTGGAAAAGPPPVSASGGVAATGNQLQCSKCRKTYSSGVFCTVCGGKLEKAAPPPSPPNSGAQLECVQCHKTFSSGTFCTECGGKLQAASVQSAAPKNAACPSCGSALPPKAKFCTGCGKPVLGAVATASAAAPVCPNARCGKPFSPGLKFCTACGTRLSPAQS